MRNTILENAVVSLAEGIGGVLITIPILGNFHKPIWSKHHERSDLHR